MKILDKIKLLAAGVLITGSMMAVPVFADTTTTTSTDSTSSAGKTVGLNDYIKTDSDKDKNLMTIVNTIINLAIGLIGLVAVVMMIIGGFQYTMSQGEAGKVKKAKDTIMYGIIGLVVAILSFAIVKFVLEKVFDVKV